MSLARVHGCSSSFATGSWLDEISQAAPAVAHPLLPTKQELLDALFADGFTDLSRAFEQLPASEDNIEGVVEVAVVVVDHCVANPERYHLMF